MKRLCFWEGADVGMRSAYVFGKVPMSEREVPMFLAKRRCRNVKRLCFWEGADVGMKRAYVFGKAPMLEREAPMF